jgi:Holliday junction resolvasome RuvABC endonuclease subunit
MILGIDLSITSTGFCSVEDSETFTIREIGSIITKPKKKLIRGGPDVEVSLQERITEILEKLKSVGLQEANFILIEDYAFGAVGRGATMLAELQGIVRYHLYHSSRYWKTITPQTVKQHGTGKGNTKKNMVPMLVAQKFAHELLDNSIILEDDNQADAFSLAHLAWLYHRTINDLPISTAITAYSHDLIKKVVERPIGPQISPVIDHS